MAEASRAVRWSRVLLALAVLGPLAAFIAVAGMRLGIWDWTFGYSVLTLRAGVALAALGLFAGLAGGFVALQDRRARAFGLAALAVGVATAGVYGAHIRATGLQAWTGRTDAPPFQATTDLADPPVFTGDLADRRDAAQAQPATGVGFQTCDVRSVPTQVAPGVAAYALERAGFEVLGFGVGRADGTRAGMWFGFTYDAVIRIRPGRTDIRVAAREARPDGGEACRLTRLIADSLQPGT